MIILNLVKRLRELRLSRRDKFYSEAKEYNEKAIDAERSLQSLAKELQTFL